MKIPATIALALMTVVTSLAPVQAQTCNIGFCGSDYKGDFRHDLFVERQYRDFLLRRYPSYGSRYRGRAPDISIGPGATVGGPVPGTIGGQRLRQRQAVGQAIRYDGDAHVRWCRERYISYRSYDNTFQPFDGSRRPCNSPYN